MLAGDMAAEAGAVGEARSWVVCCVPWPLDLALQTTRAFEEPIHSEWTLSISLTLQLSVSAILHEWVLVLWAGVCVQPVIHGVLNARMCGIFPHGGLSDGCGLVYTSGDEWVLLTQGGRPPAGSLPVRTEEGARWVCAEDSWAGSPGGAELSHQRSL